MKRLFFTLLTIATFAGIQAQEGLHIASIFKDAERNRNITATRIEGREISRFNLTLFRSLEIENQPRLIDNILSKLQQDAKQAVKQEEVLSKGRIVAAYYQLPPRKECRTNSFILFRKQNNRDAMLIYMEGRTELDKLIEIFVRKTTY